ncbi:hypothetical protein MMC20_002665 [Loxospora ochrophaea]|nr:hypothetical protein [Loxospora ochrophaea]
MPDKPITVITYAASASLAAIALVYFFTPNYLIDGESSTTSASARRKGVVGLLNPANDCFINCILQSLAGLGDLRLYLIRELHRRQLGGPDVYTTLPSSDDQRKHTNAGQLQSLQSGEVTQGLKDMIDKLNERPIYKKTISAQAFIAVLEHAFGTRISKTQQDAQELLQIVAERLSEEYHAGLAARNRAKDNSINSKNGLEPSEDLYILDKEKADLSSEDSESTAALEPTILESLRKTSLAEEEDGFPLEGRTESQIECQYCRFMPKVNSSNFVMLTLAVPQTSSTSLSDCFDAHFKTEYIDDYLCDRCRLEHALEVFKKNLSRATSEKQSTAIRLDIAEVEKSLAEDPEKPPESVKLPDKRLAPKRRVARSVHVSTFPKILVIHLSRSIYDPRSYSKKNAAKVSFPESLPLGGILNRRKYKLLSVVTHKGTHNSGHYQSFRRQYMYAPYSTPHVKNPFGPYNVLVTPGPSTLSSPKSLASPSLRSETTISPPQSPNTGESASAQSFSSSASSTSLPQPSTRPSSGPALGGSIPGRKSTPTSHHSRAKSTPTPSPRKLGAQFQKQYSIPTEATRLKRRKKPKDRWWHISDEKIKECKTGDVLGMQREVYLLFYEMEKE